MAPSGHRHLLILYMYTLNRWWRMVLGNGLVLLILALGLALLPLYLPQDPFLRVESQKLWAVGGIGIILLITAVFLIAIRRSAYVQPFKDYLRLSTPFLRLNISYRRIRQASTTEMSRLFNLEITRGWRRQFLRPLAGKTAVVLELTGFPIGRTALRLFLSPFFFADRTARLVLLVPDWMAFSTEMESFRSAWAESSRQPPDNSSPTMFAASEYKG